MFILRRAWLNLLDERMTTGEDEESSAIHAGGLIIRDLPFVHSNFRAQESLDHYLARAGVVGIADIDTRQLTRILRDKGAQAGVIIAGDNACSDTGIASAKDALDQFPGLAGMDLAKQVTTSESYPWTQGTWVLGEGHVDHAESRFHVVAYDFGVKRSYCTNDIKSIADICYPVS